MAALPLLPKIESEPQAAVVADGFSCQSGFVAIEDAMVASPLRMLVVMSGRHVHC